MSIVLERSYPRSKPRVSTVLETTLEKESDSDNISQRQVLTLVFWLYPVFLFCKIFPFAIATGFVLDFLFKGIQYLYAMF